MKDYLYDTYNTWGPHSGQTINELSDKGWKKLQYKKGGDFNNDYIQGYRPMTKKEIRDREKALKKEKREEIKELKKLAKRYGYTLVANKGTKK